MGGGAGGDGGWVGELAIDEMRLQPGMNELVGWRERAARRGVRRGADLGGWDRAQNVG